MNDLNVAVQSQLIDRTLSHEDRAVAATILIEKQATADFDVDFGTPLPIPLEWEHRVPTVTETHASSYYDWSILEEPLTEKDVHQRSVEVAQQFDDLRSPSRWFR